VLHDLDFDLHRSELVFELFPRVRSLRFDELHLHYPMMLGLLGLEELQLGSITRVIDATQIALLSLRSLTLPPDADWDGVQY
jgi:hypothetical protein